MDWSNYKNKKGKTGDFAKKEEEMGDMKRSYIAYVSKRFNSETGEAMADSEIEYTLAELESEKKKCDDECARFKAQSDGLALAIEDFKKL